MTTKSKAKSAPKPKAKPEAKPEVAQQEQTAIEAEVNPVFDPPASPDTGDLITAKGLAHAGREYRAGRADRKEVLATHDAFFKQADNTPADVDFAKRHKRAIESLPR